MNKETGEERSTRIIGELKLKYPNANVIDMGGNGKHFAAEIDPAKGHPEYDRAIEVIIESRPHKHLKMTQHYKVLSGTLELHVGDQTIFLNPGNTYIVEPNIPHWAKSDDEAWAEIYSEPGWTPEDHILV